MSIDYIPRFSFEISEEQKNRANKLLAHYGLRRALFTIILDDVLDLIEEYGGIAIGLILDKSLKPRDALPSLNIEGYIKETIDG